MNSVKSFYEDEKAVFSARKEAYFLSWAKENRALLCSEVSEAFTCPCHIHCFVPTANGRAMY